MMKMTKKFLFCILFLPLILAGCPGTSTVIPERYFLAYAQVNSSLIRVRYSDDGITWTDGNFPSKLLGTSFIGVGALSDEDGIKHIVMVDSSEQRIFYVKGTGPQIWRDYVERTNGSNPLLSAPAGVYVGDDRWMVSYHEKLDGTTQKWEVYDNSQGFMQLEQNPYEVCGTNLYRPALTIMNGEILTAGCYAGGDLFTKVAHIQDGLPTPFFPSYDQNIIPLPSDDEFVEGFFSSPDVTHDYDRFYMVIVRKRVGNAGWGVEVLESEDGLNWSTHSRPELSPSVDGATYINIAGQSNGNLLIAAIKRGNAEISAAEYRNGQWSNLDSERIKAMFGSNLAAGKQFTLIGTGRPTQSQP